MTKLQTWNEAKKILEELGLASNAVVVSKFETLLAPKKSGGGTTRPAPINQDGELFYFCRFTGNYFTTSEMIYQNDDKRGKLEDKGYSNIGYSIWNKGQKWLKDSMKLATEINFGIIEEFNGQTGDELRAFAIELYKSVEQVKADNSLNNAEYLMDNFLSDAQADSMAEQELPEL